MGLFSSKPRAQQAPKPASDIPVAQIDLSKRYDIYVFIGGGRGGEERLYENVRFLGIRTFDRITEFTAGFVHGFLEIETPEGARIFIPHFGIATLCEHGTQPTFKLLRRWGEPSDY